MKSARSDHVMVRTLDPDRVRFPAPDDPNADPIRTQRGLGYSLSEEVH